MIALLLGLLSSASLAAASRALAECCDDCPCTATRYLGTSKHILPDAPCPEGSVATVEALRAAATEGKFEVLTWSKNTEASRPRRRRGGRRRATASRAHVSRRRFRCRQGRVHLHRLVLLSVQVPGGYHRRENPVLRGQRPAHRGGSDHHQGETLFVHLACLMLLMMAECSNQCPPSFHVQGHSQLRICPV